MKGPGLPARKREFLFFSSDAEAGCVRLRWLSLGFDTAFPSVLSA